MLQAAILPSMAVVTCLVLLIQADMECSISIMHIYYLLYIVHVNDRRLIKGKHAAAKLSTG